MMFLLMIRFVFFLMIAIVAVAFALAWSHGQSISEWIDETVEYFFNEDKKNLKKEK